MNAALLSSDRMDWRTPTALLVYLDGIFDFDGDAAPDPAHPWGRKRMQGDTLMQNWPRGTWWLNPPYGRALSDWIAKADAEADCGSTVVCLVPARPDTRWWAVCVRHEITYLAGRVTFQGAKAPAPFPSAIVVMRPRLPPRMAVPK